MNSLSLSTFIAVFVLVGLAIVAYGFMRFTTPHREDNDRCFLKY